MKIRYVIAILPKSENPDIPVGQKIYVDAEKRLIIKTEDNVFNFDFRNADVPAHEQSPNGYSDIVYRWNIDTDTATFYIALTQNTTDVLDTTQESDVTYPAYLWLAEGETETTETPTITPDWLPTAATETEIKAGKVAAWKDRIAKAADTFDVAHIGENSQNTDAWKNTIKFFESWIGGAWYEVELFVEDPDGALTETQIEEVITLCEQQVAIGAKKFFYENNVVATRQAWKAKFTAYEIWTVGDDFLPDADWFADTIELTRSQSDWDELIDQMYPKAQAHSVGVEL